MLQRIALLLLAFAAAPAAPRTSPVAGIEAVYATTGPGHSVTIRLAAGGDFDADLGHGRHVIRKDDEVYLVEARFTGSLVTRLSDAQAVSRERRRGRSGGNGLGRYYRRDGDARVQGRSGEAFAIVGEEGGRRRRAPALVISRSPGLAPLGSAWTDIDRIQGVTMGAEMDPSSDFTDVEAARLIAGGAPLRDGDLELLTVRPIRLAPDAIAIPAAARSAGALKAALAEAERLDGNPSPDVVRVGFAERRLWMLDEAGALSSMTDGGGPRLRERLDEPVVDLCVDNGRLLALTASRDGSRWRLNAHDGATWRRGPVLARQGEGFVAWACENGRRHLLTTGRLLTLEADRLRQTRLSKKIGGGLVTSTMYVTPGAAFLGRNAGEWGGGLIRVDRRSGAVQRVDSPPSGDTCGGALNGQCDPVNAIAPIPWRPGCVAAAVGLVHLEASGRLAAVCPSGIALLFAQPDDPHILDARFAAQASAGGFGAVPFFGLAARGRELIAVGADAFYRIGEKGLIAREPFPRFRAIDGVVVSFVRSDGALVLSGMNRRASMSGAAPLVAWR